MKKIDRRNLYQNLFMLVVALLATFDLIAQSDLQHRNSIQFTYGFLHSFHYNAPTPLRTCFEGCYPQFQQGRNVNHIELGFYHRWSIQNELMIGVGLNRYEFLEKGQGSTGAGIDFPFTRVVENKYYSLSLGQRYSFRPDKLINPFFENHLLFERLRAEDYNLKSNNLAFQSKLGMLIKLSKYVHLVAGGVFKSAIINYGTSDNGINYFPFVYGGEIGLTVH